MLARYNTLANRHIYETCDRLSDGERKQIRPAFFKSIHDLLTQTNVKPPVLDMHRVLKPNPEEG